MKQKYHFVTYLLCKSKTLLFLALLFINNVFSQTYTDSTPAGAETFVVPAGVTSVTVEIWGGGGSGGGSNNSGSGGSGGGGGGYSTKTFAVLGGQVINYNIGLGGAQTTVANGAAGTATTLSHTASSTAMNANGGTGGGMNSGAIGTGGTATGGTTNTSGSNGILGAASGGNGGNGGNAPGTGGLGQTNADGSAGSIPGGGGGGGERGGGNRSGGTGANGRVVITYTVPGPANDNCTGAIALTIGTSCSYISSTNQGATASTTPSTPPAPGCASYSGGDVWFSFIVPASGEVTVDLTTGVMTDSGMAWYTGTCGALALLQCDDDSSVNGLMSSITRTGLTPGATIYVRVWEYGNDNLGTFGICATSPPVCTTPTAQPTALTLNTSSGNITGSFTAASPIPTNYLVVYNTTNTIPNPANGTTYTIGGTIGAGNIVADIHSNTTFSLTGLASNTTYYFFVFAYNTTGCTGGPLYLESPTAGPLTNNITTGLAYCSPTSSSTSDYITRFVTTGGINDLNHTSTSSGPSGYGDYYSTDTLSATAGATINFVETFYFNYSHGFNIWIDYNNDGTFAAGELEFSSAATAAGHSGSFAVNVVAAGDYRIRVRAWESNNNPPACGNIATWGEAQDYKLTVLTALPCAGTPSTVAVSAVTTSTATVTWTAAAPAPASGYQISITTTNGTPAGSGTHTTAAGVTTLNATGLLPETTYYVYVRANCGGIPGQGYWIGPVSFKTPCAPGSGTGTSTLGCPNVISGGLGLNGADPAAITCSTSGCTDLEATYLQLGQTTSYTAQSIPYTPPYQFGCLTNSVSVNTDDVWSPLINLPFNFCFYGNNFNQCLIGSNGVLTFDTTGNTPGGSSTWSFSTNVPSTSLFRNTIFGVYHDIDPSKGGTVGWELVTLNSGCRALVASWKDIPMFSSSCNSMLYTGMMVLYENTNIIEVYIKEKNVWFIWNSGNEIVGLKNSAGTIGTAAASRNGIDTDWTTATEAWRFVPSGTSITSIKWYEGAGTTGPVVGTTPVINVCPSATTIYTAEVTYTLCNGSTLKETDQTTVTVSGNKTWTGATNTDWNTAGNWSPVGIPNNTHPVVIPNVVNDPIITGGVSALACSVTVQNGGILTINTNNNITVTNAVSIAAGGQFIIQDDASLVQVNNVINTGNIEYRRTTNIRLQDYVYWSSPVANFPVTSVSPGTTTNYIYKWLPTTASGYAGNFGNWSNTTENMITGKGYIVRGPNSFSPSALTNYTASFIGVPNNGNISSTISRSTYTGANYTGPTTTPVTKDDDNWNLIGNPYPSAIDAKAFMTANTDIAGYIKLWTHGTLPAATADPFYANYTYNYSASDYITYNLSGPSIQSGFNGYIGGGQGFFVLMNDTPTPISSTVSFTNAMRSASFSNAQFYRQASSNSSDIERNRIWLNLSNSNNNAISTMIGYIQGASNTKDRLFDARTNDKNSFNIYSLLENDLYTIQGKQLPFNENDYVNIGYSVNQAGEYKIGLAGIDGLFTNKSQNIYLEDKLLNVYHDLKKSPYTFSSNKERINNRFVLRYTKKENITNNNSTSDPIFVFVSEFITIESSTNKINNVKIYDVQGKLLVEKDKTSQYSITINELKPTTNVILVKVTIENGDVLTKKIVY